MSSRGECVRNEIELTTIIFSFFPIRACSREVVRRAQCSPSIFFFAAIRWSWSVSARLSFVVWKIIQILLEHTKGEQCRFVRRVYVCYIKKAHWILMKMFSDEEKRTAKLPTIFICFSDRARQQQREERESAAWWVRKKKKCSEINTAADNEARWRWWDDRVEETGNNAIKTLQKISHIFRSTLKHLIPHIQSWITPENATTDTRLPSDAPQVLCAHSEKDLGWVWDIYFSAISSLIAAVQKHVLDLFALCVRHTRDSPQHTHNVDTANAAFCQFSSAAKLKRNLVNVYASIHIVFPSPRLDDVWGDFFSLLLHYSSWHYFTHSEFNWCS